MVKRVSMMGAQERFKDSIFRKSNLPDNLGAGTYEQSHLTNVSVKFSKDS